MPSNRDFEVKNGLRVASGLINANSGVVAVSGNVTTTGSLTVTGNTALGVVSSGNTTVVGVLTYGSATAPVVALGTIAASGTAALNFSSGAVFTLTQAGAATYNFTNLPTGYWEMSVIVTNAGLGSITFQNGGSATTVNWVKGDGTSSTTFSTLGVTLQSAGTNHFVFWGVGNTIYGKAA